MDRNQLALRIEKMDALDALIGALEKFPRLGGILLGVAMHPLLAAIIGR